MKIKTALILLISVLILVALGFGISIIYSDYIYNPNGTLSTLQIGIENDTGYIDSTISSKDKQFLVELDQWAKDYQATIIFKDGLTAGAGYCSYSNWEQNNLEITKSGDNPNGVYVLNSQTVLEPYASEGVFLPNMAGLEIAGYYSESLLPLTIKGCDFLYPITAATTVRGMYFTDTNDLDALIDFFENHGYTILSMKESSTPTVVQLIQKLITDGPLAMAVLVAMTGLMFCFVYVNLVLYRDITRTLKIHHLFGLSIKRMISGIAGISVIVVLTSTLLFRILLANGLTYLSRSDLNTIFRVALVVYIVLAVIVNMAGCHRLFRRICQKGCA